MKAIIVCLVCCFTVLVTAVPTPLKHNSISYQYSNAIEQGAQQLHVIQPNNVRTISLREYTVRDWLTDLIRSILQLTVGELLSGINEGLKAVMNHVVNGLEAELQDYFQHMDADAQEAILNTLENARVEGPAIVETLIQDLELVLPAITSSQRSTTSEASELIEALLGISLEELLYNILDALEASNYLLVETVESLTAVADTIANDQISNDLKQLFSDFLLGGQTFVGPHITNLNKVLTPQEECPEEIIAGLISESTNVNVTTAAKAVDAMAYNLEELARNFSVQLHRALQAEKPHVREKLLWTFESLLQDVTRNMKPVSDVFFQFIQRKLRRSQMGNEVAKDITETLVGVGLKAFLAYVDQAAVVIPSIYNTKRNALFFGALWSGLPVFKKIAPLIIKATKEIEVHIEPFIQSILPILGEKKWVSSDEFFNINEDKEKVFCDFSLTSGNNLDVILHFISQYVKFDIVNASSELVTALSELDNLFAKAATQLTIILENNPVALQGVNRTLNVAINSTAVDINPILDIFVEFIPNEHRHNTDRVTGITRVIHDLKFKSFKNYVQLAALSLEEIVTDTILNIESIITNNPGGFDPNDVRSVINRTLLQSEKILEKFKEIIEPIMLTPD